MATRAPPANPDAMLAAMDTSLPEYELYAIRYATREARRAEHFIGGDPHDAAMPMDYFVWLAIGPERTFVVDMGFSAEVAARRHREYLRCPAESLRLLGVDPASVHDVIVTHLHYDHAGNFDRFPAATFHIQEPEIHFATGRHVRHRFFSLGYEVEDVVSVVRLNYARRVMFHVGAVDLGPGISLVPVPGHTPGQQAVRVHTRRGWVVLASDATHFYENIRRHRPFPAAVHLERMLESFDTLLSLVPGIEHVVPGHDPLVIELYPPARPDLAGIVARLDVPPKPLPPARPPR